MRYRLRTLLMVLLLGPPAIAWGGSKYAEYRERERLLQEWRRDVEEIEKLRKVNTYDNFQLDVF